MQVYTHVPGYLQEDIGKLEINLYVQTRSSKERTDLNFMI